MIQTVAGIVSTLLIVIMNHRYGREHIITFASTAKEDCIPL